MADVRLSDVADDVLTEAVAVLTGQTVAYPDAPTALLPDRQTVQPGPDFSWEECEQLAVHVEQMGTSQPTSGQGASTEPLPGQGAVAVPHATVVVTLVYCQEVSDTGKDAPDVSGTTGKARRLLAGAGTLLFGLHDAVEAGTLLGACSQVTVGPCVFVGPEGMYAAAQVRISVTL